MIVASSIRTLITLASFLVLFSQVAYADCVVLLHGLARTENSMGKLEKRLSQNGYEVINDGYPSTEYPLNDLIARVDQSVQRCGDQPINFVTHSMGGILVRAWAKEKPRPNLRRVVMLGPPNQGSELVDHFGDTAIFKTINGAAGLQLGTKETDLPKSLGPANFDLGIIAGNLSVNPIFSQIIPGKDDGKVAVASTKLDGMNEHLTLHTTHTFIMSNSAVIQLVLLYLETGSFKK